MTIRIRAIRNSARGEGCTINIDGVCNHDPETTVLAHYNEPGHGTMGGKDDDTSAAYACSACHDMLDGRTIWDGYGGKEYYWMRGMRRTWKKLVENEVLTTGRTGSYMQGQIDLKAIILDMVSGCTDRDPTMQKLVKAIEEL